MNMQRTMISLLALAAATSGCGGAREPVATPAVIATNVMHVAQEPIRAPTDHSTFKHRAPVVGDRLRVHTDTMSRTMRADGVPEGERYVSDYELIVRATTSSAVTDAFVVFHTNERHAWDGQDDDYRFAPKPTALAGKRLHLRAEPLLVEEETGGPVSAEVSHLALAAVSDIGMRGAMEAALPDKELVIGERVDGLGPALVRALNPRTWHAESGGATLRALGEEDGTFETSVVVRTESNRTLSLTGTVRMARRDRTIQEIELRGTYEEPDKTHGDLVYRRTAVLVRAPEK
jgi:hypothetical protein